MTSPSGPTGQFSAPVQPHPQGVAGSPPPSRPVRRRLGLVLGLVGGGVVLVVAILVIAFLLNGAAARQNAELRYADAVDAHNGAVDARDDTMTAYAELADLGARLVGAADVALAADSSRWFDADAVSGLEGPAEATSAALLGDDQAEPDDAEPVTAEEFDSTEQYTEAAEDLEASAVALDEQTRPFSESRAELEAEIPALEDAVALLAETLPETAARTESENLSSTAVARIQLEKAAAAASAPEAGADLPWLLTEYVRASEQVVQSQAEEVAEKDRDGLLEKRLAVEEFVRSIVGDTRVDFDWAPIVNGLGDGDSAGGYTWWWYEDGGYSTMMLSDSVARSWDDPRYVGLVVHEAGHSITSQCKEMLDTTFAGDVELMATAWAIGMGYDDPWGNGVDYYYDGVPPEQRYIDASKSCR